MHRLACGLTLLAAPSMAQDDLRFSTDVIESCLAGAGGLPAAEACVGKAAVACMEETEDGTSTYGQNACLDAELFYWGERMTKAYGRVAEKAEAFDVELETRPNGRLSAADSLAAMQTAWGAYRDAACDYAMSKYNGGSGTSPANLSCQLGLTARQALALEAEEGAY